MHQSSSVSMVAKLDAARSKSGSCVCVGLDPDPAKLPVDDVFEFNRLIVDATHDLVAAYKPQFAFYEAMGISGLRALEKTIRHIRDTAPDAFIIGDAKRGDTDTTAAKYAEAMFGYWGFDACTVNGYQGSDSIKPFLEYEGKGVFVVCRTSNPSSPEIQDIVDATSGEKVFMRLARHSLVLSNAGNIGLVVGATYPEELASMRTEFPEVPFLIPGVGAQGGDAAETARIGGGNILINSSRGIIYAYASASTADYALAAREAVVKLRAEIAIGRA